MKDILKIEKGNVKMNDNIKIGKIGEDIAKEYLKGRGYQVLEKNCRTRYSEIDLVCQKNNEMVFVEVRTKTNERFGSPEETINRDKINRLTRAANAYAAKKKWQGPYRIDAVCIVLNLNNTAKRIEQYNIS